MNKEVLVASVAAIVTVAAAGFTTVAMPPENPKAVSRVTATAVFVVAIACAPVAFRLLQGEAIGALFTSTILLVHLLAITGKQHDRAIAERASTDLKMSASHLGNILMTYAFLFSQMREQKEYYSTSSASAQSWLVSMLLAALFLVPDVPFDHDSYSAYHFQQMQFVLLSYSLGFFVSGVVLSHRRT